MEEKDIKSRLISEFEKDPIYRLAVLNGLQGSLFTEGILSMHEEITYSTVEAGKIIERSDSTIRNHFRSDLIDYIEPEKFGKFYRLNYKSVFRLHLIFLLMEKSSKTTVDLLAELGMQPAISVGNNFKKMPRTENRGLQNYYEEGSARDEAADERFLALERNFIIQEVKVNILKYQNDLREIDSKISYKESSITNIKTQAYLRYLEEKQSQLLTNSLKKSIQKPSLFGLFKKQEEVNLVEISNEIEIRLKGKMEAEIESDLAANQKEIQSLREEREKLNALLIEENEKFSSLQLGDPKLNKVLIDSHN